MILAGSPRGGRTIALALLALLLAAAWVGPVSAYLDALDAGAAQLAQRQALLQRYQALSAGTIEPTAAAPAGPPVLFPEIPEAQALALLQETVKSAAAVNRIQIRSLQVLRSEVLGEAARIGVRIHASGDVASLGHLLYAVEAAHPVLYPDNLQVQSPPPAPGGAPGTLEFQLDVSGFRAGPQS
ncbi:MAG TPA: type II secretion system protein GspM [Stellaceae bacterium]|jgi:hypothetical protein|nr:type II secretion system protein GspM [Stellaceae bacterium]